MQAVIECELPLAGIYLLPTVSQGLVERLQLAQTNLLLVSSNSSGLRLTFLRERTLRISLLARIDATTPQAIKNYAEEISNTRLYLHALRVMTLDEQLSVLIVDSDDTLAELAGVVARDNPNIECRRLARAAIVARIGIAATALDSSAERCICTCWLHAPDSNLAPPTSPWPSPKAAARHKYAAGVPLSCRGRCITGYDLRRNLESGPTARARRARPRRGNSAWKRGDATGGTDQRRKPSERSRYRKNRRPHARPNHDDYHQPGADNPAIR